MREESGRKPPHWGRRCFMPVYYPSSFESQELPGAGFQGAPSLKQFRGSIMPLPVVRTFCYPKRDSVWFWKGFVSTCPLKPGCAPHRKETGEAQTRSTLSHRDHTLHSLRPNSLPSLTNHLCFVLCTRKWQFSIVVIITCHIRAIINTFYRMCPSFLKRLHICFPQSPESIV